jgi:hypothetical protein
MFDALKFFGRLLTAISLTFAFFALGFAHNSIPRPMSPELAAYVASGGSISDICGGDHDSEHEQHIDCDACRIADSFVILQGCKQAASGELEIIQTWRFVAKRLSQSQGLDPARLSRAPPSA